MNEIFLIEVPYRNSTYTFEARLLSIGYTYKIDVEVAGATVSFEPDEERRFRAVVADQAGSNAKLLEPALVQAIGSFLEKQLGVRY
ncbi:hypothetical protein H8S90_13550 [Olivibacter sp. SDN3]|uniref:hypothetical protein n=1 Tax=Olivibacter sp. SDN3 TaxID=2764720 RepID=UPI0016515340|nr:hypothetical protein [Olivibacter sp. SDN3]QNL47846.1 hypothetical protein H8S90_13550 [Olivibacter sp. SDN3]